MDFKWIWERFKYLFFRPKAELEKIQNETGRMGETYLILLIICILVGLSGIKKHGWYNLFSEPTIWYVSALITTFVTWKLGSQFEVKATWAKSLKINVFASVPLLLCITASNIIGYRLVLLSIGFIYSVYILYFGIKIIFEPKEREAILYCLLVVIVGALSNYIARVLIP